MFDKRLDNFERQQQKLATEMKKEKATSIDTTARNQFAALEKKFEAETSRFTRLATAATSTTTPPRPSSSTSSSSLASICTAVIGGLERDTLGELALETARGFLRHLGLHIPPDMESPYMLTSVVTIKFNDRSWPARSSTRFAPSTRTAAPSTAA